MVDSWIGKDLPTIWLEGEECFLLGHGGALYLVPNRCPHRGGPLKFGFIDSQGALVCPLHKNAFPIEQLIAQPGVFRLEPVAVKQADLAGLSGARR